jgi:hypothetical protein
VPMRIERPEHLVGRDMVKAEALRFGLGQRAPIAERLLQQDEGADHIGLYERGGPVDGFLPPDAR